MTYLARRAARHYVLFLAVLAVGLLATAAVVRFTDQIYRSETVILYRSTRPGTNDTSSDASRRVASRLQDMLMSRERIGRVIKELSLYPEVKNRDEAADEMRKKIAFRARDGNTFLVTFDAESPALAQAVVARLAASLIEDNMRLRVQEAEETRRFLNLERLRLREEVKAKEAALTAFLRSHPGAVIREGGGDASGAGMDELQREMERLRGSGEGGRPDPDVIATIRKAEADYDQAQKDVDEKQQRLTDVHPDLIAARGKVRQAETHLQRVREAAGLVRPAAAAAGGENREQVAALERQMARLRRAHSGGGYLSRQQLETAVMFESLRHELDQARGRLAGLEDKQFEAGLAAKLETSSEIGQLAILDAASRPGLPAVDVRKKVGIGGVFLALIVAMGVSLLRARSDDRIHDRADAEWLGGKPVLVLLPPPPREGRRSMYG
jgi:uncharacterized protein involved in exopolysaccharide biosynthesis